MKVFLSHSHADADIAARLVRLFEDGLDLTRQEIFCSSLPGYGFRGGEPFRSKEISGVLESDIVISILGPSFTQSAHCLVELGVALTKPESPILVSACKLDRRFVPEPVNDRLVKTLSEASTLDDLSEAIRPDGEFDHRSWEIRRSAFLQQESSTPQARLDRGFWSEDIVDGAFYLGSQNRQSSRRQISSPIERREPLPSSLLYSTDHGYRSWLSLTEDATYLAHSDSIRFFSARSKEIASAIARISGADEIDFVSLGPGGGKKDLYLLRSLAVTASEQKNYLYPFYYPFDCSVNLLETAVNRVGSDDVIRPRLGQIKMILADFKEFHLFSRLYQYRPGPNVISILGNNLCYFQNEVDWLQSLRNRSMFAGDLLLLETANLSPGEDIVSGLGQELRNKRFDFGPLELLHIPYDPDFLTYKVETGRSQIPETQTTLASYASVPIGKADGTIETFNDVRLSQTHRYNPNRVQEVLEAVGFQVEHRWSSPEEKTTIFLASNSG